MPDHMTLVELLEWEAESSGRAVIGYHADAGAAQQVADAHKDKSARVVFVVHTPALGNPWATIRG